MTPISCALTLAHSALKTSPPTGLRCKCCPKTESYPGWNGLASALSLVHFNSADTEKGFETIEIDSQHAKGLGLMQGAVVRVFAPFARPWVVKIACSY